MYGRSLVPLGEIADVRFGVKSGKDAFFLPRDCTSECLERCKYDSEFTMEYRLPRRTVVDGHIRLVRCGEKLEEIRPIEAEYLESEIHSLMEVDEFVVHPATCSRSILLAGRDRESISDKHVLRYIEWGESQGYHKNPTCASRATEGHEWYDLTQHSRPDIVLPKIQQYRLLSFLNPAHLYQNSSLLGIYDVPQALVEPLCAILNSTLAIVSRLVYARMLGNEGNIQLDVYSAKMMLVPNVAAGKKTVIDALTEAFRKMCARKALGFLSERRLRAMTLEQKGKSREIDAISDVSELDMSDRFDLDDAAFRLLGVTSRKQRHELIGRMYAYLREYFEWTRQKEEKAIINKNRARRHGVVRPEEIALQVYQEICDNVPHLLRRYDSGFLDKSKPFDTYDLPLAGRPELHRDMYSRRGVNFKKGKKVIRAIDTRIPEQDEVISAVAASGVRGLVRVPCEIEECNRIFTEFSAFVKDRDRIILELVEQRTADEDTQVKIREALLPLLHRHVESGGSHRSHEE